MNNSFINILQKYKNDKLIQYSAFSRRYANLLKKANLPFLKLYTLRHTFTTRILETNIHPKVAQQLLGHTTATIKLDIYSHILPTKSMRQFKKRGHHLNITLQILF